MNRKDRVKLAALQIEPSSNLTDTFLQIQIQLDEVCSEQDTPDCVVLPEYAFGTFREWASTKQDSDQKTAQIQSKISQLAQHYHVLIVAGSIPYQTDTNQWRNRSFVISPEGDILGSYDKQHPFRAEKLLGLESGTKLPIFKLKRFRMAVLICSDLWFHDLLAQLVPQIDFLAVPTMTTVLQFQHISYGRWAWHSLVSVRAKEFIIPIVSADQSIREYAPGVFTCGGSCIADPSYRFTNTESPETQALKVIQNEAHSVTSTISLKAVAEYASYRQDVGLR